MLSSSPRCPHNLILIAVRGLDFTPPHDEDVSDDAPIIVVTHGLTGGSQMITTRRHLCTDTDSRLPRVVCKGDLSARSYSKIRRWFRFQGRCRQLSWMQEYLHHITQHGLLIYFIGAGVPVTSPQLYSAGHTEDYRAAMLYIRTKYPKAPLLGIGFSLGANVITRYVAEEGDKCRLVSAVALGCVRICYHTPRADVNVHEHSHGT